MIARLYGKNIFFCKNTAEGSSKVAVSFFIHKAENGVSYYFMSCSRLLFWLSAILVSE